MREERKYLPSEYFLSPPPSVFNDYLTSRFGLKKGHVDIFQGGPRFISSRGKITRGMPPPLWKAQGVGARDLLPPPPLYPPLIEEKQNMRRPSLFHELLLTD